MGKDSESREQKKRTRSQFYAETHPVLTCVEPNSGIKQTF